MAASLVVATAFFAVSNGVAMEAINDATGLAPEDWSDRDGRLPNDVVARIWCLILEAHPGRLLTFEMAKAAPWEAFGAVFHGVRYAPDIRRAIGVFLRYRGLLSDQIESGFTEDGDEACIHLNHPSDALDRGAGSEVAAALVLRFVREGLGLPHLPRAVHFRHSPRAPAKQYVEALGLPVVFDAAYTALVLDRRELDSPLPECHPQLFEFISKHLARAAQRLAVPDGLGRIRAAVVAQAERADYSVEGLAGRLGLSVRALQREVKDQGCTARALLEDARTMSARELLADPRLSVEEVALLLGYSQGRAFRRAFRRQTGQSPAEFRRQVS